MPLIPLLQPDLVLGASILDLTPALIALHRIEGMLLDVDDTIVPIGTSAIQLDVRAWIEQIQQIVPLWLVTNNPSQSRISGIADSLSLPYFLSAAKPSRKKLRLAVEAMKLDPARVAMVGDRIFTDVLAGNRLGMFTILVEPMSNQESSVGFHLLRSAEFAIAKAVGVSLSAK